MNDMEATRAWKKTATVWDLHRSTVEELYHTKQLEGDDGVIETMRRDHGFRARYVISLF
jgi:hypothetical protein